MQRDPSLRRRRRRGRRVPRRAARRRRVPRASRRRCAGRGSRGSASARPSRTTSRCSPRCPSSRARTGVPMVVGTSRKSFLGRASSPMATRSRRATTRRSRPSSGPSTTARASSVSTTRAARRACTPAARCHGRLCCVRGRWAQGLEPRGFCWIIKDRLAASERPGGFARNHRKVRRQEELIWLAGNGFTHVLSLLDSPHNLHAYDEASIAYDHVPLGPARRVAGPAARGLRDARALARRSRREGARAPRGVRRAAHGCPRGSAALHGQGHRRYRTRSSSSRRSPAASSARPVARSSR